MDFNSLLFPAPKSSYRIGRVHGELLWIPKSCADEEDAQRLCTMPDMPTSPLRLNSSYSDFKIRKNLNKPSPHLRNVTIIPQHIDSCTPTTSGSKVLLTEETVKSVDDVFSFANQINDHEKPKNMNRFKRKIEDLTLQAKGDIGNDSADEKVVGDEEVSLPKSLNYYRTTPKVSIIDSRCSGLPKESSKPIARADLMDSIGNSKSSGKKPTIRILQNTTLHNITHDVVSNKNIQVIKTNLSFKNEQNPSKKANRSKSTSPKSKFSYEANETHPMNIGENIQKKRSNPIEDNTKADKQLSERSDVKKLDKDLSVDREEEFSQPPTVRVCYQQRYMYPKASLQMNPQTTPSPRVRPVISILAQNENTPKLSKTNLLSQDSSPSLSRAQTPTYNLQRRLKSRPEYIPCMLLRSGFSSSRIMIYFHGNGEDINIAYELLSNVRNYLRIHVLAVEYPGYGVYQGTPNESMIFEDAERVYEFLVTRLKVDPREIIVFGRSIGSGPASHLASKKTIGALVLMSAFTSIKSATKDIAGTWAKFLIKERFDNLKAISQVSCPTFFVHGQCDNLVPYHHSKLLQEACKAPSELFLPKKMNHVEFEIFEDFVFPLKGFLEKCGFKEKRLGTNRISFPRKFFETPEHLKPQRSLRRSVSPIRY